MKYFFSALILLTLISCRQEEVESYDDLTPEEQEAIRNRATAQCMSSTENSFEDFKTNTNNKLNDYLRGRGWKIDYTSGATTTSSYLYVWKVNGANVYFLYKNKVESTTTYYFIKMTQTINGHMIDNLQRKKCEKEYTVSTPGSSVSIQLNDVASTESDVDYKTNTTWSSTSSQPLFMSALNKTVVVKKLDDNGNVSSSETFTYTAGSYADYSSDLRSTYDHSDYANRKYCVMKFTAGSTENPYKFSIPYFDPSNCVSTDSSNINTSGDALYDFTPNTELVNP